MNSIENKVRKLAETLLIKGELTEFRKFDLPNSGLDEVTINPYCNRESSRTVVHKVIETNIVDIHSEDDEERSTLYVVEVLAAVCYTSFIIEDNEITKAGGSEGLFEGDVNTDRRPFTFLFVIIPIINFF